MSSVETIDAGIRETEEVVLTGILAPEHRVLTAMVTPFNEFEEVDYDTAQTLARNLIDNGSDGLVLTGTTGESSTLTFREQLTLFEVVREAVGREVLLVGGTGSNNTREARELSAAAERDGNVDQLLLVTPYYVKPSQEGIYDYFKTIGRLSQLPKILYNIPGRTGGSGATEDTIKRLMDENVIMGIKDATGSTEMSKRLKDQYGDDIRIYSGDDSLNLEFASIGASGTISVASHWAGIEIGQMLDAEARGDMLLARSIDDALQPSYKFESFHVDSNDIERDVPNPIPAKVMMAYILGRSSLTKTRSPILASSVDMDYLRATAPQIQEDLYDEMSRIEDATIR